MKVRTARLITLSAAIAIGVGACDDDSPVVPINHQPVISSLTAVPDSVGPQDSIVVTCVASDPDGNPLVYDWFTDTRLRIKGAPGGVYLYNAGSVQVFYYGTPWPTDSIAWITCYARDQRGMHAGSNIIVNL
jgi:hypothetical protein